jgi:hypothetical protein
MIGTVRNVGYKFIRLDRDDAEMTAAVPDSESVGKDNAEQCRADRRERVR